MATRKRVLVTGVLGFSGRYLTRALSQAGLEVHGLARSSDGRAEPDLPATLHVADIRRPEQVRQVLAAARPTYVVHLAGIAHAAHNDLEELYLSNIVGTRNLLGALADQASGVEQVVLVSSANVYGNQPAAVLDEDLPPQPVNDYGISKLAVEHLATMFADRLPLTTVRPFNYTGAGQSTSFLIPKIVDHFRRRESVIELGNLDIARDFSDVRDVCEMYRRLLGNPDALGKTLNLCSAQATALREIVDTCSRLTGHAMEVRVNPAFVRANEVVKLSGSLARLNRITGPMPRRSLEDTLRWMLEE